MGIEPARARALGEAKALAKLEEVTAVEREVKKTNFTLLLRVKNGLDPEQQAKVRAYKPFGLGEPPDLPDAPPPQE